LRKSAMKYLKVEYEGGGTDFSTCLADGSHTGAAERFDARIKMAPAPPLTIILQAISRKTSFAQIQPPMLPTRLILELSMTSTASALATPQATVARQPALGTWKQVINATTGQSISRMIWFEDDDARTRVPEAEGVF